jgi:predicted RNase H-like nuclease
VRTGEGALNELGQPIVANYTTAKRIVLNWQMELKPEATIQLIDQPTIVNSASGQRPVENLVGSGISRSYGGMQPFAFAIMGTNWWAINALIVGPYRTH